MDVSEPFGRTWRRPPSGTFTQAFEYCFIVAFYHHAQVITTHVLCFCVLCLCCLLFCCKVLSWMLTVLRRSVFFCYVIRSIRGKCAGQSWLFDSSLIVVWSDASFFHLRGNFVCASMFDCAIVLIMFVWKAMLWFVGAINCNCKCDVSSEFEVSGWTDSLERLRRLEHWLVTCWFVLCFRALIVNDIRVHVLNLNVFQIGMLGF